MKKILFSILSIFCFTITLPAQTILLQESFEGSTFPPTGWTTNTPGGSYADGWTYGPQSGLLSGVCVPHGSKTMTSQWATYYPNNAWAFTPGLSLTAGTSYKLTFKQCVQSPSSNKTESLKITVGTQAIESSQSTVLLDLPTLTNTGSQSRAAAFTPTASGVYYFAFNCYSAANQRYLSIDSVNVYTNAAPTGFPLPYCAATFTQGIEPLTYVGFGAISNTTSAGTGTSAHENYTALTTTVQTGKTYTMTLKGNTNGAFTSYLTAYVDWNQNNLFDTAESYTLGTIYNSTGTDGVALTQTLYVPASATLGNTRMRIIKRSTGYALSSCNADGAGQAEDYSLAVTGVTSISVTTQGNVAAYITTNGGTLQMVSTIYPSTMSQLVNWSITAGSGNAGISSSGLVTAQSNGNVWAKATSLADATKRDSVQITIINQAVPVTSITVTTQNNVSATITTNHGTLQMVATLLPSNASQAAVWSIIPQSGNATINSSGLVTALNNGTVWAKALAQANQALKDSMLITISNQVATGLQEVSSSYGLTAAPNPFTDKVKVYIPQKHPALTMRIYDVTGKLLKTHPFAENELNTSYELNTTGMPNGIWFVELKGSEVFMMQKWIKVSESSNQ